MTPEQLYEKIQLNRIKLWYTLDELAQLTNEDPLRLVKEEHMFI